MPKTSCDENFQQHFWDCWTSCWFS